MSEPTYAVVMTDEDVEQGVSSDVLPLEEAVKEAKWLAGRWPNSRYNVYKLVQTHTFAGKFVK